ncbi:tripartite tricarboxylate transporter substrate binding protein [Ramlibacter sp. G-1-2-2]|uniref:Tripartite tricarboxylate transporter substrate binding protein n=1 Tax=Ramlibacter agri TaxID=2728837 RepID=A0A848HIG5_9BURK|nr:tripartite tricarboxylate transporter substrate binding protein [Ramlibacter agri]NML48303.1 tripartite tricarboxylate transporter substrate binding protein [Ramlibacter agri]
MNKILLALAATLLPLAVMAQAYPSRPVTLVVPFPPGGGTDTGARLIAQALSTRWGQPVVIDNRGGAGGIVGADIVARAKPDGYTLLMGNVGTQAINPPLYGKLPYNPEKAFAPISLVADLPIVLVTYPGFKATNVKDLVALGKAEPNKYTFASSGTGNSTHLAAEIFMAASGAKFLHVPYKGGGLANTDVIAGHVDMQFTSIFGSTGFISSGKFRPLAVSSETRSPALPNVPTLAEEGVKNAEMGSWLGVLAPAGTPQPVIDKIAADIREVVNSKEVRDTMIAQGATPRTSTPAEFAAVIAQDLQRFTALVRKLNIHAE